MLPVTDKLSAELVFVLSEIIKVYFIAHLKSKIPKLNMFFIPLPAFIVTAIHFGQLNQ